MKQNTAPKRETKREKVGIGPGLRECKAGHETDSYRELRRGEYPRRTGRNERGLRDPPGNYGLSCSINISKNL